LAEFGAGAASSRPPAARASGRLAAEHRTRLLATFALLAFAVGAALHWPEQATLVTCAASESRKA
jgi:hypothetical protein